MKLIKNIPLMILLAVSPFFYGSSGCNTGSSNYELFEQAWNDFDQNYSYFEYKNIDWNGVKEEYGPKFQKNMTGNAFAAQLGEMLQVLHDWHVYVEAPNGKLYGYEGEIQTNYPTTPRNRYVSQGYQTLGNNVIWHGMIDENGENIGYIRVDSVTGESFSQIGESDIESLFQTYADAEGMIIDIRPNSGGDEENAGMIVSHLIEEGFSYGYTVERSGPNHGDFTDPEDHALEPSTGTIFTGPVVGLIGERCMSSAEWFTLMMKRAPNITLIGDTTRGASGFPRTFSLDNGVSYAICRWVAYTYEDQVIEDNGIAPDIAIPAAESVDGEHDYVLERAISFIQGGETVATTSISGGSNTTTTVPGGSLTTTTVSAVSTTTTTASSGSGPTMSVSPTSGIALETAFSFSCQPDQLQGQVVSYWWDFDGDGAAYGWDAAWGVDEFTATNSYSPVVYWFPGNYTAYVIMWDASNNYEIASVTVQVTE